jgi:broad specificity phosphatase PhoE
VDWSAAPQSPGSSWVTRPAPAAVRFAVSPAPRRPGRHPPDVRAGLADIKPDPDLLEWDYGGYEGMTAAQIQKTRPGWHLWRDGVVPGDVEHPGEQLHQVALRTDAVLDRVRPLLSGGDVALVAHGHLQRVLTAA